jgi:DNA-binding LytR/AlgR family response regulator
MSVDSERMLKLEIEVKEQKIYIDKLVGLLKSDSIKAIESLVKSVSQIKVYNKAKLVESEKFASELKKEFKAESSATLKTVDKSLLEFNSAVKSLKIDKDKQIPKIDMKSEIEAVVTKEYINKLVTKDKPQTIDFGKEIKSVVNKQYINAIYRNK